MTTTARTATRQIATTSAALFELVILGIEFDTCEICELPAAELFWRIDNRDGAEVRCCEDSVPTTPTCPTSPTDRPIRAREDRP